MRIPYLNDSGWVYVVRKIKALISIAIGQKMLDSDVTVYVATTGSDTTGDGSQSNPFATIQKAVDKCPPICSPYKYTINISSGTYSGATVSGRDIILTTSSTTPIVRITGTISVTRGGKVKALKGFYFVSIKTEGN